MCDRRDGSHTRTREDRMERADGKSDRSRVCARARARAQARGGGADVQDGTSRWIGGPITHPRARTRTRARTSTRAQSHARIAFQEGSDGTRIAHVLSYMHSSAIMLMDSSAIIHG